MNKVQKGDVSALGKSFTVKTDRPIGTAHPKHPEIIYPVNYGFVPDLFAGDGEEQDVYILGVDEPVDEINVTIVAIVFRSALPFATNAISARLSIFRSSSTPRPLTLYMKRPAAR